jgi:hypothetical protein
MKRGSCVNQCAWTSRELEHVVKHTIEYCPGQSRITARLKPLLSIWTCALWDLKDSLVHLFSNCCGGLASSSKFKVYLSFVISSHFPQIL